MKAIFSVSIGFLVLLSGVSIAPITNAKPNNIASAMGHGLAESLCTTCHLVEPGQTNPPDHVGGPAFQTVANRPKVTERSLRKHLQTTHSNDMIPLAMPNPGLSEDELIKIISYIVSLHTQP
jgi:hypothetical protein